MLLFCFFNEKDYDAIVDTTFIREGEWVRIALVNLGWVLLGTP
jgi:hypothetical protein